MFEVTDRPLHPHAVKVVVEKCEDRNAQRDRGHACRRRDAGDQAEQIIQQDEEADAGNECLKSLVSMPNHGFSLAAYELVDHFCHMLRRPGILNR